jgi:ABC-2 type transport system permease protein
MPPAPELLLAPADAGPAAGRLTGLRQAAADSAVLAQRSIRMAMRRTDAMLTALLMPVLLMLVFGYLFGGAVKSAVPGVGYITYLAPGVVLTCVMLGASTTAVSASSDLTQGIIDRFRSLDINGIAFIAGYVSASTVRNAISAALIFAVAIPMGLRSGASPMAWLAVAGLILLLILAVSWLAALGGLAASSPDAASSFTFFLMLIPFTSSAFVPVATMPHWLQAFARNQPATTVIDSIRLLLEQKPTGTEPWLAVAWWGGLTLAAAALSPVVFQHRTR